MSKVEQAGTTSSGRASTGGPEAIAKRAYELFLQRGSEPGHEVDDWLQAEAELTIGTDAAEASPLAQNRGQDRSQSQDRHEQGHARQAQPPTRTAAPASPTDGGSAQGGSSGSRRNGRHPNSH